MGRIEGQRVYYNNKPLPKDYIFQSTYPILQNNIRHFCQYIKPPKAFEIRPLPIQREFWFSKIDFFVKLLLSENSQSMMD